MKFLQSYILVLLCTCSVIGVKLSVDAENSICKDNLCDLKSCCSHNKNCKKLGDGKCDNEFNIKECLWDAGDCLACDEKCYLSDSLSIDCNDSCYPKDYYLQFSYEINAFNNEIIHYNRNLGLFTLSLSTDIIEQIHKNNLDDAFLYNILYFSNLINIEGQLLSNEISFTIVSFFYEGNFTSNRMRIDSNSLSYINLTQNSIISMVNTKFSSTNNFSISISTKNSGDNCLVSLGMSQLNNFVLVSIWNCFDVKISNFYSNGVALSLFAVNTSFALSPLNILNATYSN